MHKQRFHKIAGKSRESFKALPGILHFSFFITVVMIAVLSLNFEVFRVVRIGDVFLVLFAFIIGANWYGQRQLEAGYQDGLKKATEGKEETAV